MVVTSNVWVKNPPEEDLDLWVKAWVAVSLRSCKVQFFFLHMIAQSVEKLLICFKIHRASEFKSVVSERVLMESHLK